MTDDQSAFAAPPPDPELKRLEPLLGTWTTEDHTLDSIFGPSVPVRSTETFRWLDGGYFLVQDYATTFGDEPTQKGVNYWFDVNAGMFRIIFFSNNGPFSEAGSRYSGRVVDGRLTFEGPARFHTSSMRRAGSGSIQTARSRSRGGSGTRAATGNRG
jgi:Protein of unknown function (DUF1579)